MSRRRGLSAQAGAVIADTFAEIIPRYLKHQEARLTDESYERTRGIIEKHLKSFFGTTPLPSIRRQDVQ